MTIEKDTRVFKLFSWCIRLLIAVNDGEPLRRDYLNEGTDLCHFVRTILVTMPVYVFFQVLALVMPVLALLVMPYVWFETKGMTVSVSIIIGMFIVVFVGMLLNDFRERKRPMKDKTEPTFRNLITTYIKSKKSRICPLIYWKESK
jgi:hypothetical protein